MASFSGKATYLEPGWLKAEGSHDFLVYVEDRNEPGEGTDRFWLADGVMGWGIAAFGYTGLTDPAILPLFMVAMAIFGLVTMPLGNAWSRWREVKADEYALRMTRNPEAFASAMTRLANQNLAEAEPPAWVEFLLHSHPSISKRVAMAQSFRVEE